MAIEPKLPAQVWAGSSKAGLWGGVAIVCSIVFRHIYRVVGLLAAEAPEEAKSISEKIKLLSTTINVLAAICIGAGLADMVQSTAFPTLKAVVFFFLAVYAHIGAQRFLSLLPSA